MVAYAAQYPFNSSNAQYWDLVMFKGGNDWGNFNTIDHLSGYIKVKPNSRFAGNDSDRNNGHLNVVVLTDGKVYIANVVYNSSNNINRPWYVTERNDGYSYISSENGIIIYQYDGFDEDINVLFIRDN